MQAVSYTLNSYQRNPLHQLKINKNGLRIATKTTKISIGVKLTSVLASKYTKSTRLLEFQFKLLHRRIATNDFLNKVGLKDNSKCSFCGKEQEKLRHLFWECSKVVLNRAVKWTQYYYGQLQIGNLRCGRTEAGFFKPPSPN